MEQGELPIFCSSGFWGFISDKFHANNVNERFNLVLIFLLKKNKSTIYLDLSRQSFWVVKEIAVFKTGLMALGATQRGWWGGNTGYIPRLRKIYTEAVLKMPEFMFSFVLPRVFWDLMSTHNPL